MKKWNTSISLILVFLIQVAVIGVFLRGDAIPNLFLLFAISLVVIFGFKKAGWWLVLAGLLMDVGSMWPLGTGTMALVIVSWLVDKLKILAELRSRQYIFAILLSFLFATSALIFDLLMHLFLSAEHQMGLQKSVVYSFDFNIYAVVKISLSIVFGIIIYLFSRNIKLIRRQGILAR